MDWGSRMRILGLIAIFVNVSNPSHAEQVFYLTERSVLELLSESPEILRLETELLHAQSNYDRITDMYSFSLDANLSRSHSREDLISSEMPTTTSVNAWDLSINRPLDYGIGIGLGYSTQGSTSNQLSDATTRKLFGRLSIDLYRDFLGRTSQALLGDAKLGFEAARIQKTINNEVLKYRVRALYWNYVATKESRDFAAKMLATSQDQVEIVKRKVRSDVANSGDVARFSSQVSERQAQKLQFEGSLRKLQSQLGELFPGLIGKKIELGEYNKQEMIGKIYTCLNVIGTDRRFNPSHTLYDELFLLKLQQLDEKSRHLSTYSDVDVKLEGQMGLVGTGIGGDNAHRNLSEEKNTFDAVALKVSIPLDGKKHSSEESQLALARTSTNAEVRRMEAKLQSLHSTLGDSISLVKSTIEIRSANDDHLRLAIEDSRRRFRQARITSQQLVQDEDKYLSNAINLIAIQKDILLFMFDYLALFTESPCKLREV